jgi:hypothetical protein
MRTLILALTVLLFAAPVWATVTITLDDLGDRKIAVNYTSTEGELIRAFALDITATDGNIIDVNDYAIGDDNNGYGIFPGSFAAAPIAVNPTTGQVDNWAVAGYSPVAPAGDPDALPGIGTSGVTIELGSLYDTASPSQTAGMLCTITVDEDVTEVCVTANAIRGNVVLESAAEVQNLVMGPCWTPPDVGCIPAGHGNYAMWTTLGKPPCWCGPPNGSGFQCRGDADGVDSGMPFKYQVYLNDLSIMVNNWKKKATTPGLDPCADFDRVDSGMPFKYQVYLNDLTILVNNWKKKAAGLTVCP